MQFICEYKRNFQFESYLDNLSFEYRSKVSKIRLSDHRLLPIEKLRYENIDRSERICDVCNLNEVEDENHYLISCSNDKINESRKDFIQKCILKFYQFLNNLVRSISLNIALLWRMKNYST